MTSCPGNALEKENDRAGEVQEPKSERAQHDARHEFVYPHLMHVAHLQEGRQRAFPHRRIGIVPRQARRIAVVPRDDAGEVAHAVRDGLRDKIHSAAKFVRAWQCIPAGPRHNRHARRHRRERACGQPPASAKERKHDEHKRKERCAFARELEEEEDEDEGN